MTAAGMTWQSGLPRAKRSASSASETALRRAPVQKNQSNNYPSRLQKLLGSGFSVINCGKASSYVMSPESGYNVKASQPELYYPNTAVYKTAISASPDVVILALGTNDARSMTDPAARDQWIKDYKALIADFAALDSKPQIYLSVCLPAVNAALTYEGTVRILPDLIRQVGEELDLPVLETGADLREYYKAVLPLNDKVHPDDTTYEALAVYMYNHVFGGSAEMPSVPVAKGRRCVRFRQRQGDRRRYVTGGRRKQSRLCVRDAAGKRRHGRCLRHGFQFADDASRRKRHDYHNQRL